MRILAVSNIYPTRRNPMSGPFVKQQIKGLRAVGLKVKVLFVDRAQGGMQEYFWLKQRVRSACKEFDPDIVHCMYGGIMADMVTRVVVDRPTVVSFCGSDLLGEMLSGPFRKLVSYFGTLASFRAARRADGVVVKSLNLQEVLPQFVTRSKIRIIPNGVDLNRFRPLERDLCRKQLGWENDRFHVLFPTNSGDPCKRIGLALAGNAAFQQGGFKSEFHELQNVAHQDVPVWLNASDVVLLTSLHEGSPNIIKEALACNVPIVSVDVGDVRERIESVQGCYIADPTPSELALKLQLVHSGSRRVAGRNILQELSLVEVANRLANFYSELLDQKSANFLPH